MPDIGSSFGESIGEYEVLNLLGKGGFASVYRGRCQRTGLDVAIKMIDKKLMRAAGMADRVRQEVAIHSRLKHPSVLELLTFFEDANYVYLVLELCSGGELQRFVRNLSSHLKEDQVRVMFRQVVQGLLYLHSHRILHRDLTLANLLLTEDMSVKIADFGLATQLKRAEDKHLTMCGTPNYISPEVAMRSAHGLEADVWGLGCMLYTLLVGRPPFDTDAVKSTLTRVVMADFKIPDHVSPEARDLLHNLLKKNPKERIKLQYILEHPFMKKSDNFKEEKWLADDSGLCTMSSRTERPGSELTSTSQISGMQSSFPVGMQNNNQQLRSYPVFPRSLGLNEDLVQSPRSWNNPHWRDGFSSTPLPSRPVHPCLGAEHQPLSTKEKSCCVSHSQHQCCNSAAQHHPACERMETAQFSCVSRAASEPVQCRGLDTFQRSHSQAASCCSLPTVHAPQQQASCSHSGRSDHVETCQYSTTAGYCSSRLVHNAVASPEAKEMPTSALNQRTEMPTCLSTLRLQPVRHRTKNVVLSILASGEVGVEFLKRKPNGEERVIDVCRISSDGIRIIIYRPNKGKGCKLADSIPELPAQGADYIFSYENLPEKHVTKYLYAARFVDLVKSVTPKVTFYSDQAKCMLMENSPVPNFEANFFDGKYKIMALRHCEGLDSCLVQLSMQNGSELPCFPVVIGRRRVPLNLSQTGKENKPSSLTPDRQVSSLMRAYSSLSSTNNTSNMKIDKDANLVRSVFVPGVGLASQLATGEVQVQYSDGSRVLVDGDTTRYITPLGEEHKYNSKDSLPQLLSTRLASFPTVLQHLLLPQQAWANHNVR
ncbi:hypothetical protein B566_EDAN015811 [Ephemera danica]|nr:hypothetical protein B566_EDAN015811 [Ephemera danica]